MSSTYNRYIGNSGKFVRVEEEPRPAPRQAPDRPAPRREPAAPAPKRSAPRQGGQSSPAALLRGLLPAGTDPGDLLLFVLLLLLYLEKEDEEYLIALFALLAMGR